MRYKDLFFGLKSVGYSLSTIQTGGNFHDLTFTHDDLEGEIYVTLDRGYKIKDGKKLNYDLNGNGNNWIEYIYVETVNFNIDLSISYQDIYFPTEENMIFLSSEKLGLFPKVIELMKDKYAVLSFNIEYSREFTKFTRKLKKLLPLIEKYGLLDYTDQKGLNGDIHTLHRSLILSYGLDYDHTFTFIFSVLDWEHKIFLNWGSETMELDFNLDLRTLKKGINKFMKTFAISK